MYLQGTNCSFRRSVLEEVEGFDEEIEYNFDESEVCSRIVDAGHRLAALDRAVVHHKFLPSHMRREAGFTDPFLPVKNRAYFALRVGREHRSVLEAMDSLTRYVADITTWMHGAAAEGDFTAEEAEHFERRAHEGFALGVERGMAGVRKGRGIEPVDPTAFKPYPTLRPVGRRLAVCFVSHDYPPRPLGGIGRFTHDLARGFSQAGHEAHVVTRDDEHPYRIDFEDGVWVHRFPVHPRHLPALGGAPLRGNLEHAAAVHSAVERVAERVPLDVVSGSLWVAEPLLCALQRRWPTAVACNTPMRKVAELQPETAAAELTPHQVRLEDALLTSPATLQPVSHENARLVATVTDKPLHVIHHGVADRRADFPPTTDEATTTILFAGRLEPRKGVDTLLEAAVPLLRDHDHARLVLCGADNPHANGRPHVHEDWVAAHAADVADRITFTGHVTDDELYAAYAGCDVFCAPSRYESFGLTQVEAMMMGKPVVACDVGGMKETVKDGETGRLVPPGDTDALREALDTLLTDVDLRERLGAQGRARYEAEFRNEVAVARNVELYTRIADEPIPHGPSLPAVLVDLCGLDPSDAEDTAKRLLDPTRFPVDLEAGVRHALQQDDAGFVDGVYRTLLGRPARETDRAGYVARLAAGSDTRLDVVREVARSDEARARDVDPQFLNRLPTVEPATLLQDLGSAWLIPDDDTFAASLVRVLDPHDHPDATRDALRAGLSRADAARRRPQPPGCRRPARRPGLRPRRPAQRARARRRPRRSARQPGPRVHRGRVPADPRPRRRPRGTRRLRRAARRRPGPVHRRPGPRPVARGRRPRLHAPGRRAPRGDRRAAAAPPARPGRPPAGPPRP